jgi:hypothetical protein
MIQSLVLPKAAGLPFGNGDVKHLGPTDANSAQSISFCTRNLAERDNILASKINDIVAQVNNKEQIIDIQVPRISLVTGQTLVISNFRIPSGFEARVLNAVVASIPSNIGRLEVLWSSSYGSSTGDTLVSTLSEVSGQTTFWPSGQLIVRVTNTGSSSIEVFGDVQITMRPVAVLQGSILVPSIITSTSGSGESGASGYSGQSGASGARGASGYSGYSGYSGESAASFSTTTASFVMPSSGSDVLVSVDDSSWISVGQVVYIETAGYFEVLDTPSSTTVEVENLGYSGNASGATVIATTQQVSPGGLQGASGGSPSYATNNCQYRVVTSPGTAYTAGTLVSGPWDYSAAPAANSTTAIACAEVIVRNGSSGLLSLNLQNRTVFAGTLYIDLPSKTDSIPSLHNWITSETLLTAVVNDPRDGGTTVNRPATVFASSSSPKRWGIFVPGTKPFPVSLTLTGQIIDTGL